MENNNQGKPITKEAEVRMWKTVGIILIVLMIGAFILAGFIMIRINKHQQDMGKDLLELMNNQTCEKENVTVCQIEYPGNIYVEAACDLPYDRQIQREVCRV